MSASRRDIAAVYVLYRPDRELLERSVTSIAEQVDRVILVDNSPAGADADPRAGTSGFYPANISWIPLGANLGIAAAQNIGMRRAADYPFIMLSDQDTVYPPDYVDRMLAAFAAADAEARARGSRVAALGPDFSERNRGGERQGFVRFRGPFSRAIHPRAGTRRITHAIASGLVIATECLPEVGLMRGDLFIDWVDLEWCWRAAAAGWEVRGNADVVIDHSLGDRAVKVGDRHYPVRSVVRHYYIIRNAVYLGLRGRGIPPAIRINVLSKMMKYLVGFTLLGRPRAENLRHCLRGVADGALGRLGPMEGSG